MTPEQVVALLLDRRVLDLRHVVQGGLRLEEVVLRNRSFRVVSTDGPSFFAKVVTHVEHSAGAPLEAALYSRFMGPAPWSRMRPFVPALHLYDEASATLVLELAIQVPPAADAEDEELPVVGAAWARALAACHSILTPSSPAAEREVVPAARAYALDITRPVPEALRELSLAQLHLLKTLQAEPDVDDLMETVRQSWTATAFIHGDMKWSNVLVDVVDPDGGAPRTLLVDWETASLGDPAWDVGSVFHSYLAHAVASVPSDDDMTPEAAADAFAALLPAIHADVRRFWSTYADAARLDGADRHGFLERSSGFCAARLLHTAYEWSQQEEEMPRRALAALQLGLNFLRAPVAGRVALLGLDATTAPA